MSGEVAKIFEAFELISAVLSERGLGIRYATFGYGGSQIELHSLETRECIPWDELERGFDSYVPIDAREIRRAPRPR